MAIRNLKFSQRGDARFTRTRGGPAQLKEKEEARAIFGAHWLKATPERKACLQEMKDTTLEQSGVVISLLAGLAVMKKALTAEKFM
jgi:hypothetical protein